MSGVTAARELKKKKMAKKKAISPKRKSHGFSFTKSRSQEIAELRRANQVKVLEKLQQAFQHFSIPEEKEATLDSAVIAAATAAAAAAAGGSDAALVGPPVAEAQEAEAAAEAAKKMEGKKVEEEKEGKGAAGEGEGAAGEGAAGEGVAGESKAETEQNEEKVSESDAAATIGEGGVGGETKESGNEKEEGEEGGKEGKEGEEAGTEGKEKEKGEGEEGKDGKEKDGAVEQVAGEDGETEETKDKEVSKEKEALEETTEGTTTTPGAATKKKKKGFMSSMSNMMGSIFGKKKEEKKKVWKAVPGALPSGKKDAEYWRDLVTHYNELIQKKEEEEREVNGTTGGEVNGAVNGAVEGKEGEEKKKKDVIGSSIFWAHFNLAMGYDCRGRHEDAIPHYERALNARPDSIGLRYRLGVLLSTVREHEVVEKEERRRKGKRREESDGGDGMEESMDGRVEEGGERGEGGGDTEEREEEKEPASQQHFRQVIRADPTHSGALYELASYEHEQGRYQQAMNLLRQTVEHGVETVDPLTREEYLGAPTLPDAKAALATVLSLECYGSDDSFGTIRMLNGGSGAYDPDVPLAMDEERWDEAKRMFASLRDVRDSQLYLPPIIQHVLGEPPSRSKF